MALDNSFSNNFSLFQLKKEDYKIFFTIMNISGKKIFNLLHIKLEFETVSFPY